jgi:hypothetical protein
MCCGKERTLSVFLVELVALLLRARVEQDVMALIRIWLSSAVHLHLDALVPQPPMRIIFSPRPG